MFKLSNTFNVKVNGLSVADLHTKVSGAPPPPNTTKFFRFYICFHQKVPVSEVGTPSNEGWRPPTGNPGSAPAYEH